MNMFAKDLSIKRYKASTTMTTMMPLQDRVAFAPRLLIRVDCGRDNPFAVETRDQRHAGATAAAAAAAAAAAEAARTTSSSSRQRGVMIIATRTKSRNSHKTVKSLFVSIYICLKWRMHDSCVEAAWHNGACHGFLDTGKKAWRKAHAVPDEIGFLKTKV